MTGLTRYTSSDMGKILDAVGKYSVGLDDVFHRLHSYGMDNPGGSYKKIAREQFGYVI